jgi:hypothetical protein
LESSMAARLERSGGPDLGTKGIVGVSARRKTGRV